MMRNIREGKEGAMESVFTSILTDANARSAASVEQSLLQKPVARGAWG